MEDKFERCLRKAVREEVNQYQFDNSEALWKNIEMKLNSHDDNQKNQNKFINRIRKRHIKTAVAVVLIFAFILGFSSTKIGEATIFGSIFRNLLTSSLGDSIRNISFSGPEQQPEEDIMNNINPDEVIVIDTPQAGFEKISLIELKSQLSQPFFIPENTVSSVLTEVLYQNISEEYYHIMLSYKGDALDFSLLQEKIPDNIQMATGYDEDDTDFFLVRDGGIEYMVLIGRYNMIRMKWFNKGYFFTLYGNLTEDQALDVARSLTEYN